MLPPIVVEEIELDLSGIDAPDYEVITCFFLLGAKQASHTILQAMVMPQLWGPAHVEDDEP
jgi:hypothetical protein